MEAYVFGHVPIWRKIMHVWHLKMHELEPDKWILIITSLAVNISTKLSFSPTKKNIFENYENLLLCTLINY